MIERNQNENRDALAIALELTRAFETHFSAPAAG